MTKLIKENSVYKIDSLFNEFFCGVAGRRPSDIIDFSDDLAVIRNEEKELLNGITSLDKRNILFLNQTHEDNVFSVKEYPSENGIYLGDGDAVVTNLPGVCPVIRTADCVPVFLFDNKKNVIGAVHSGWRSTKLGIVCKAVNIMRDEFLSEIKDISMFILPSIGPESYEVQMDVAQFFDGFYKKSENGFYLNLWDKIENDVEKIGFLKENIFNSRICNLVNKKDFYTYRGGDKGRNLNFCYMK